MGFGVSGWEVGGLGGRERREGEEGVCGSRERGGRGEEGGVGVASVVVGWPGNGERSVLSRGAPKVTVALKRRTACS